MSKSSTDYSEIAGLSIALSNLKSKPDKSTDESVVISWLNNRLADLRAK